MGKLDRLELENFKSYHGKQVIGPFDNFTCIIGPNGAGKSNLMDAISFVLGVNSLQLRSRNLKDLIFRKDKESMSARMASVKLIYKTSDNEMQVLNCGEELSFSRSISASGVSTYRLDDKEVTYTIYESMLEKVGVLVKARNFLVFQGDIESVASMSPKEITKLFEQICGSDILRQQYENMLKLKDEAEENTMFSLQKKKIFSTQHREVKEQKEEAEIFHKKKLQYEQLRTEFTLWQIFRFKMDIEEHKTLVEKYRSEEGELHQKEVDLNTSLQNAKQKLAKITKQLTQSDKAVIVEQKKHKSLGQPLSDVREKMKRVLNRQKELKNQENKLVAETAKHEASLHQLQGEIATLETVKKNYENQLNTWNQHDIKMNATQIAEYGRLKEEATSLTASVRAEMQTSQHAMNSKNEHLRSITKQMESMTHEIKEVDALDVEYKERLKKLQVVLKSSDDESKAITATRDKHITEMHQHEHAIQKLNEENESVMDRLQEIGNDHVRSKKREKMNEAIQNMKRIFIGVHGKLEEICKPIQKKYEKATAMAFGRYLEAIVVDTKETAADCIRYLKDQRIGTVSFIPLDNISNSSIPDRLRTLGRAYVPCYDIIDCKDIFRPVIHYVVGSTMICDDLNQAQELVFSRGERLKVVTLNGQVIHMNGAMTGGFVSDNGRNIWQSRELEQLQQRKNEINDLIQEHKSKIPSRQIIIDHESSLRTINARIHFSQADCQVIESKLSKSSSRKEVLKTSIANLDEEKKVLDDELATLDASLKVFESKISAIEQDIFIEFSRQIGVEDVQEFELMRVQKYDEIIRNLRQISEQIAATSARLDYEKERNIQHIYDRVKVQAENAEQQYEELNQEETNLLNTEKNLLRKITTLKEALSKTERQHSSQSVATKEIFHSRTDANMKREIIAKKISGNEIRIARLRSQLHEVLQSASTNEISLPVTDEIPSDDATATGESQRSATSASSSSASGSAKSTLLSSSIYFSQDDHPTVRGDQDKVAVVDLSSMEPFKSLSNNEKIAKEEAMMQSITTMQLELEQMQPNLHATTRYQEVMTKLRSCNEDLETSKEKSRSRIEEYEAIRTERLHRFNECFNFVSHNLGIIYKDLTRSNEHPLGGSAYLTLDNTDEPYLGGIRYTAMPPMKRFRDMEQLSGGEKTIAALALLFSIHSYRQAPFFVLDEVDAALDNVNVRKICNYMKQRSRDFQCIIISLKDIFFEHSSSLVGVYKDLGVASSKILTLNLNNYRKTTEDTENEELRKIADYDV